MSDLLIKNIELPKDMGLLINISRYGQVAIGYATSRGISFLPVKGSCVEISEHGDLIDKDELIKKIKRLATSGDEPGYVFDVVGCYGLVSLAPVVVSSNKVNT